jgi:hypothetical protein
MEKQDYAIHNQEESTKMIKLLSLLKYASPVLIENMITKLENLKEVCDEIKIKTETITVPKIKPSCYQYVELKKTLEDSKTASKAFQFLYDQYLHHFISDIN